MLVHIAGIVHSCTFSKGAKVVRACITLLFAATTAQLRSGRSMVATQAAMNAGETRPLPRVAATSKAGSNPNGTLVSESALSDSMNADASSCFICGMATHIIISQDVRLAEKGACQTVQLPDSCHVLQNYVGNANGCG